MDAQKRAMADDRYQQMVEMMDALPPAAKEFKFAIYDATRHGDGKASFRPLEKIIFSKFKELSLGQEDTMAAYLDERHGPGKYYIEPLDAHNVRLDKLAAWTVTAGEDDMDGDDDDMDDRPRRPSRRRERGGWSRRDDYADDDDGDPRETRANAADLMSTIGRQQSAQVAQVSKQSTDMMSIMLMTQQAAQEARASEERRRDEQRAEERRRDEDRAEARRIEAEKERQEREQREERRREEAREASRLEESRRSAETLRHIEASNKKTEIMVAAITAAVPVLAKLFEKKEDTTLPVLIQALNKPPDPMMAILLKGMMDKANDDSGTKNMIVQMGEMSKMTAQMTSEQMRSVMALSNDINGTIMKKAMDMMLASPQGNTPEGKSMIEQVMGALTSASEIVKTLVPAQPAQQVQQQQQRVQQHRAAPVAAATPAAAVEAAQAAPVQAINPKHPDGRDKTAAELHWESLTPEQQAAEAAAAPRGTEAVLGCLKALNTNQYGSQSEYQTLIGYMVREMPLDLRVAVLNGDETTIAAIVMPVAKANPELWTWLLADAKDGKPSTLDWIRSFVPNLPPSLEQAHGPADQQRAQLAAAAQATPEAPAAAPEAPVAPVAPAGTETPPAPIPGPGSVTAENVEIETRIPEVIPAGHLDPDEP